MRHARSTPWIFIAPAAIIMALGCLLPVLAAVRLGFFDWSMGTPWSEAKWVGVSAFVDAIKDPAVWRSLWTTLKFAFISVSIEMALGIALALVLERSVRGTTFFRTLFVLPMMIAPIAVGLTWRYLFDSQFGLVNAILGTFSIAPKGWLADETLAFAAIIISDIWQWTPFVFIMVMAGLAGVDSSAVEAARIDGASTRQIITKIKLPMIAHVLAITLVMRLIDAFRVLEVIYILTFGGPGDSTEVLSLHIYKTAFIGQKLGAASAISVLLLIVVATLSYMALRLSNPLRDPAAR
jgi:multiple sugar transport system permease protein